MIKDYNYEMPYVEDWKRMSGPIQVKMTNDYLFRVLLQRDEKTLKALVSVVLNLDISDITDIIVTNPIAVGAAIDEKEFHLDVRIILNGKYSVNLEMQVLRKPGWNVRTLLYACRSLDQLSHGEDYIEAGSVIQVSFTNFALFSDEPEFFSKYQLVNVNNPKQVYCDKLTMLNIDLTHITLATEADRKCRLDKWAKVFKSDSWEDIKMLAEQDQNIDQAASSIWQLMQDFEVREQIRQREANEREYQRMQEKIARVDLLESQLEDRDRQIEDKERQIEELKRTIEELKSK